MANKNNGPQTSLVVLALGILFLLAPGGNVAVSLYALGVDQWYSPLAWVQVIPEMTVFSQVWLILVFLSGILILLRHKLAWAIAIFVMAIVLALNIFNITSALSPQIYDFGFFLSSVGIIVLLFYFRYPYLDRRDKMLSSNARKAIQIPAQITVGQTTVRGTIRNISASGFFLAVDVNVGAIRKGSEGQVEFLSEKIGFSVVRVESSGIGGEFHSLTMEQKEKIKKA